MLEYHCTGFLCSSKFLSVDAKNMPKQHKISCRIQWVYFYLAKQVRSCLKITKSKQCLKNVNICNSMPKGQTTGHKCVKIPRTMFSLVI